MIVKLLTKVALSAFFGGIIYSLVVVILDFFAPVVAVIAGFVCGIGCMVLTNFNNENEQNIMQSGLLYLVVAAVISLIIGYIFLYFYQPVIIHNNTCHPNDFISFGDFIAKTLRIPDIICTILGGLAAYALSDKINAVCIYFRSLSSI